MFDSNLEQNLPMVLDFYLKNSKKGNIILKSFDLNEICSFNQNGLNLSFGNHSICNGSWFWRLQRAHLKSKVHNQRNLAGVLDLVRFMILNLYGGIYVDGDVLFLRDMSLFWTENFAYRWSQLETWNTAVLGLNKT
jgi:hypothetical protein